MQWRSSRLAAAVVRDGIGDGLTWSAGVALVRGPGLFSISYWCS